MKEEKFKKLGFFSAFSICVGSIVGIGIFFKNGSIANNVNGNGAAWISSWVISGIIAFLVAIHFGKIAMIKNDGIPGLSSWSQRIATRKENWFRHTITINYSFFYNSILLIVLSFFTIEIFNSFLRSINRNINIPIYGIVILSICLLIFYIWINKISVKASGLFSSITTVLKFIPLFIALIVGIVLPNVHNSGGTNAFVPNDNTAFESFQGIMKSLPAALFAFDAFVGVGSMSKKIKGGERVVSKVIVFGMLFVVVTYLLISISAILHYNSDGTPTIEQIITDVFNKNISNAIKIFVIFFLFVSAAGTTNAITGAALSEFENISFSEKIFFSRQLNLKFGYKKTALIYMFFSLFSWSLIAFIPTIFMNSDAFVDGMSNFIVLFFFLVYAILIFLYWKNIYIKQINIQGRRPWAYTLLVFTSCIGVILSMALSVFFVMYSAIKEPNGIASWGLFGGDLSITNLGAFILHIVFAAIFLILPTINYLLFRWKKEKNLFQDIDLELQNHSIKVLI